MLQYEFEERVVKSLETIAECFKKQTRIAEEAMKKTQELYEANMAMIKENKSIDEKLLNSNELTGGRFTEFKDLDGT